jgi:hypothetical protein
VIVLILAAARLVSVAALKKRGGSLTLISAAKGPEAGSHAVTGLARAACAQVSADLHGFGHLIQLTLGRTDLVDPRERPPRAGDSGSGRNG